MKILIIINNLGVGGAERLVVDDINEMLKRGLEVRLVTLKPEKAGKSLSSQCKLQPDFKSWLGLIKEIYKFKPDAVITHLWYSNTIGRIAAKICGVKKVLTFEHNVYDTLKTRKMFFIDRLLQPLSTRIIAVSDAVRKSLIRHGIRENRITVILNGIDISKYKDVESNKNDKFTFIFIGRLIHQKGVDILIKAFSKIENSELLVVGSGAEEESLKSLAKDLNIDSRVRFLGIREDIPQLLLNADCFVLSSRYEGLPMVLLEAIVARKPIIVSDFQSASELIENGKNGIIIPKEDVEALSRALKKVAEDGQFRENLKNEIAKISERVSIEHHIDKLLDLAK